MRFAAISRGAAVIGIALCTLSVTAAPSISQAVDEQQITFSAVAVLEVDRMFSGSAWGQRVISEVQNSVTALEAQNAQIEADLAAEESDLTDRRKTMNAEEFVALADAFDEKVRAIRQATTNKVTALNQNQQIEFDKFRTISRPVLLEIAAEMNAGVILDKRGVYLNLDAIDITDRVIARIDDTLGDGTTQE